MFRFQVSASMAHRKERGQLLTKRRLKRPCNKCVQVRDLEVSCKILNFRSDTLTIYLNNPDMGLEETMASIKALNLAATTSMGQTTTGFLNNDDFSSILTC